MYGICFQSAPFLFFLYRLVQDSKRKKSLSRRAALFSTPSKAFTAWISLLFVCFFKNKNLGAQHIGECKFIHVLIVVVCTIRLKHMNFTEILETFHRKNIHFL